MFNLFQNFKLCIRLMVSMRGVVETCNDAVMICCLLWWCLSWCRHSAVQYKASTHHCFNFQRKNIPKCGLLVFICCSLVSACVLLLSNHTNLATNMINCDLVSPVVKNYTPLIFIFFSSSWVSCLHFTLIHLITAAINSHGVVTLLK